MLILGIKGLKKLGTDLARLLERLPGVYSNHTAQDHDSMDQILKLFTQFTHVSYPLSF